MRARIAGLGARHLILLALLAALVATAALAPLVLGGRADAVDIDAVQQSASWAHPFGTDELGRDLLARVLVATRTSLALALLIAVLGVGVGVLVGSLTLVLGPRARRLLAAAIGTTVAFPGMLLALLVTAIVGIGARGAVIALAVALAPPSARLCQTLVASVGTADFVVAARVAGVGWPRVLLRHVLPNVAGPLIVQLATAASAALLAMSAMSFLGLGVQTPGYDWGTLLTVGLDRMYLTPLAALGPAAAIVLAGIVINGAGDVLADALDARRAGTGTVRVERAAGHEIGTTPGDDDALAVERLSVTLPTSGGPITPVRDVTLRVGRGERVAIVGESGSGKTLTMLAAAHLVESPAQVRADRLDVVGRAPSAMAAGARREFLGRSVALIFQEPLSALNPTLRLDRQMTEAAEEHRAVRREDARATAIGWLGNLRIDAPERRMHQYPHELSGGMRQRATIAMALTASPDLIVADEPTTALDASVQREVLQVLRAVSDEQGTAVVMVSHDIAAVTRLCDRVVVMYAGRIVEDLPARELRRRARHPYTRALLAAVPSATTDRRRPLATIPGRPPAPAEISAGCAFAARCERASDRCRRDLPPLTTSAGAAVACWHAGSPVNDREEIDVA